MDKVEWTTAATQKLINIYQQFPCLFDTKHNMYHNKHARSNALYQITEGVKENLPTVTVEEVKKKITNLRSQYSHECAKVKKCVHSGMSQEQVYEPSVWWFNSLKFLNVHIRARKGKSSLEALESQQSVSQEEDGENTSSSDLASVSEVTETPRKKQKIPSTPVEDSIVTQTVQTLQQLQHQLNEPQMSSVHQPFGEYIVAELDSIEDEDILADVKHEISNILYRGKKQFIAKRQAGIVIDM